MTKLLLRLFVKDAQNPDSPAGRLAGGKLAGGVGILCNALLCRRGCSPGRWPLWPTG